MAETASLALAVAATVGAALEFSGYLRKTYRQIDAADKDILAFSLGVRSFATTTQWSFRSLDRICRRLRKIKSPVFEHLKDGGILDDLVWKSEETERHIHDAWYHTKSVQSRVKLWGRWKWVLRKAEVMELRTHMSELEASMGLIANTITLEWSLRPLRNDATEEEIEERRDTIKDLEAQIMDQIRTIARLKEYEEEISRQYQEVTDEFRRSRRRFSRMQQALVELGTSMAEQGQVPDVARQSLSSSSSANSSGRRRSHVSGSNTSIAPTTPPTTNSERSIPPAKHGRTGSSVASTNFHPRPLHLRKEQQGPTADEEHQPQPPQSVSHAPSLRRKQRRTVALPVPPDPAPPVATEVEVMPSQAEQLDYSSVKPASNYLQCFNLSGTMRSISGYIATNGERVPTTANLDPECPQNLISVAHAARLGLTIQPHDADGGDGSQEAVIAFPNGEERKSSGEVIFQWTAGISSHKPPFNVRCLVYEHDIRHLVLGRPFLDMKNRYWNGGWWRVDEIA